MTPRQRLEARANTVSVTTKVNAMKATKSAVDLPVTESPAGSAWMGASTEYQERTAAIALLKAEYLQACRDEDTFKQRHFDAQREAGRLRQSLTAAENRSNAEDVKELRGRLMIANEQLANAQRQFTDAVARRESLNKENGVLEAELLRQPPAVVVADLAAHAAHVELLRDQVRAAEQKATDLLATAPVVNAGAVDALNRRRLALMADVHEGAADPAALDALNAELRQVQADTEQAAAAAQDLAAVADELRRRAEPLRRALADAEQRGPELHRLYWLGVARQAGAEFTATAAVLAEQYLRLMGLEHLLIHGCGCDNALLFTWEGRDLKLPAPAKLIAESAQPFDSGIALYRRPASELADAERRRLAEQMRG